MVLLCSLTEVVFSSKDFFEVSHLDVLGERLVVLLGYGFGDLDSFPVLALREEPSGRLWDKPGGTTLRSVCVCVCVCLLLCVCVRKYVSPVVCQEYNIGHSDDHL